MAEDNTQVAEDIQDDMGAKHAAQWMAIKRKRNSKYYTSINLSRFGVSTHAFTPTVPSAMQLVTSTRSTIA